MTYHILLEEDLEVLKEFFISGGDGLPRGTESSVPPSYPSFFLPRGVVENHIAHARNVIKLHGYETRELIEDLRSSSGIHQRSSGGGGKLGADTQTLLRVLCHRSDSEASQFLKKQFKIPKSSA